MSMALMAYGRYLFHYTRWKTASEDIVPSGKLRLSPYSQMRDPLEAMAPMLSAGVSYAPGDRGAAERMGLAHYEAEQEVGRLRSCTKVLSATTDAEWAANVPEYDRRFGLGWARARMWEQYAENHTGVCLVFAKDAFEAMVLTQLRERAPTARSSAVTYTNTGLAGSHASTILLSPDAPGSKQAREHIERHAIEFLFMKLSDWESEHEYRFVEPSQTAEYSYVEFGNTLVGFVAGYKFAANLEREALKLARRHNIEARQILWAFNGPMAGKFRSALRS
jgi:hypothetical protein